jgi:RHS repeat-associated protein
VGREKDYYFHDPLGSVVYNINRQATVEKEFEYDVFGLVYSGDLALNNYRGYNSKIVDPVFEIYDYSFRHYSPQQKQWMTEDPIRDSRNWYAYVGNDPVNLIDPLGLCVSYTDIWTADFFEITAGIEMTIKDNYSQIVNKKLKGSVVEVTFENIQTSEQIFARYISYIDEIRGISISVGAGVGVGKLYAELSKDIKPDDVIKSFEGSATFSVIDILFLGGSKIDSGIWKGHALEASKGIAFTVAGKDIISTYIPGSKKIISSEEVKKREREGLYGLWREGRSSGFAWRIDETFEDFMRNYQEAKKERAEKNVELLFDR